ncbi:MAG: methyltransferase domain-containing protein [Acidimicrobiia bacterium]
MTAEGKGLAPGYVWDNAMVEARRRLGLLEQLYDPGTIRNLDALGVTPGWSCLEVAGGGGSITRLLCDRVGPNGRVVSVDLDTRFLEEIEAPNLEVVRRDILADGLPEGDFDLVHVRALLMHLHERDQVLKTVAAAVRPGGWLLIEEADVYAIEALGTGAVAAVLNIMMPALAPAGLDLRFARRLPGLLRAEGLQDVTCHLDNFLYPGGSTGAQFLQITFEQVAEKVPLGADERAVIDAAIAELDDPDRWFPPVGMVAAWGRRP